LAGGFTKRIFKRLVARPLSAKRWTRTLFVAMGREKAVWARIAQQEWRRLRLASRGTLRYLRASRAWQSVKSGKKSILAASQKVSVLLTRNKEKIRAINARFADSKAISSFRAKIFGLRAYAYTTRRLFPYAAAVAIWEYFDDEEGEVIINMPPCIHEISEEEKEAAINRYLSVCQEFTGGNESIHEWFDLLVAGLMSDKPQAWLATHMRAMEAAGFMDENDPDVQDILAELMEDALEGADQDTQDYVTSILVGHSKEQTGTGAPGETNVTNISNALDLPDDLSVVDARDEIERAVSELRAQKRLLTNVFGNWKNVEVAAEFFLNLIAMPDPVKYLHTLKRA
jgi:hypothetical protein